MKRFKFTLQTVHDLRETALDKAEREMARISSEISDAEAQLHEATRIRLAAAEDYISSFIAGGPPAAHEISLRASYLDLLARREAEAQARLAALTRQREAQRERVAEAARAAQVTATLHERQRARHNLEAKRAEQNMLDELATLAAARRLRETS
jgi:flagellar export protein FliJ